MTNGFLFDVMNPEPAVVSPTLPAAERKRLQQHGSATNVELCAHGIGGNRAVGRVWELVQHATSARNTSTAGRGTTGWCSDAI